MFLYGNKKLFWLYHLYDAVFVDFKVVKRKDEKFGESNQHNIKTQRRLGKFHDWSQKKLVAYAHGITDDDLYNSKEVKYAVRFHKNKTKYEDIIGINDSLLDTSLSSLDLFLLPSEEFINKFEKLLFDIGWAIISDEYLVSNNSEE